MKTLKKMTLFAMICFFAATLKSQTSSVTENFMEFEMNALLKDQVTNDYSVSIYLDGIKIDSIYCSSKRPVQFTFNYNKIYSLRFQKQNCNDKIVIVNTHVPKGLETLRDDIRNFEIEMSNDLLKKSNETVDFPVAILVIDKKEKLLIVCEAYHEFMHGKNKMLNRFNSNSVLTKNTN